MGSFCFLLRTTTPYFFKLPIGDLFDGGTTQLSIN
jgi:hypothetical protein